jgi:hypothetical protein
MQRISDYIARVADFMWSGCFLRPPVVVYDQQMYGRVGRAAPMVRTDAGCTGARIAWQTVEQSSARVRTRCRPFRHVRDGVPHRLACG